MPMKQVQKTTDILIVGTGTGTGTGTGAGCAMLPNAAS
ncbi:MAG: hypothetical protein K0R03_2205 [Moraxellaceae bacterium]|nr:hypothetical protein [Moraxellaceae bacterium]